MLKVVGVGSGWNFILPSILRRGQLTISVSTEGTSPGLAKRIRQHLEDLFPSAYTGYLQLAATARAYTKSHGLSYKERAVFFDEFFNSNILEYLVEGNQIEELDTTVRLLQQHTINISVTTLLTTLKKEVV